MRTRAPTFRRAKPVIPDLFEEDISVDMFAGFGGASIGTEAATGKPVTIAINHDAIAIESHKRNHPSTEHHVADIWEVDPVRAVRGRHVRHLHASPDCRDFSKAKGGKPRSKSVRCLADVVVKWARLVRPDLITLENVPEFADWGPLDRNGKRIKSRKGEEFQRWKGELEAEGYAVEWRVLEAHHFGAPTSRKRLFLVARCDGHPIRWPEPTHGPGLKAYRTAAECIDFSIPCPSIFLTRKEAKAAGYKVKRPLSKKTMQRIAAGVLKYVLENPRPFIVTIDNGSSPGTPQDSQAPLSTVIATNPRHAVIAPSIVKVNHGKKGRDRRAQSVEEPLTTVCAARRGHALTAASLVQVSYGERKGQKARTLDIRAPLGTVVAGGVKHAVIQTRLAAWVARHYGDPLRKKGGGAVIGSDVRTPLPTVTVRDHHSLAAVTLATFRGTADNQPKAADVLEPLGTVSAGGIHAAEVRALLAPFLTAYYGNEADGQSVREPLRTVTTNDRFGLLTIELDGVTYAIVDIGMRMLEPIELLRAQFGSFAKHYDLSAAKTKKDQVRLIGNSVVPLMQEAVLRVNLPPNNVTPIRPRRPSATPPMRRAA